jgi:hypothetical protein
VSNLIRTRWIQILCATAACSHTAITQPIGSSISWQDVSRTLTICMLSPLGGRGDRLYGHHWSAGYKHGNPDITAVPLLPALSAVGKIPTSNLTAPLVPWSAQKPARTTSKIIRTVKAPPRRPAFVGRRQL